jgi:subtilisin-like proprotein convertase family protein
MRYLVLIAIGIILIAINVWYLRIAKQVLFSGEFSAPTVIGPFQIVSSDDNDENLGMAMAHMLRARLSRIRQELESSAQSLEAPKSAPFPGIVRPDIPASFVVPIPIPNKVFEPLAIDLSVAGMEVGGLLAWFHRLLFKDEILQIVVEFQTDKAIVVGNFDRFGGNPLYLERTNEIDDIITGVAYTFMQHHMSGSVTEVGALNVDEFQTLITTLNEVAGLNRQAAIGRLMNTEYEAPLENLGALVEKIPQWRELVHLTAQVAENAHDTDQALRFYQLERQLVTEGDSRIAELDVSIDRLSRSIFSTEIKTTTIPATAKNVDIVARLRKMDSARRILYMTGADLVASSANPRVAILGGLPTKGYLPDEQHTVVGGGQNVVGQRPFEADYIDSLVQTVQLVAPNSQFIFAPMTGMTDYYTVTELVDAWRTLMSTNPDVLLITFAPLIGSQYEELTRESIKRGIHIVFAKTPTHLLNGPSPSYESNASVTVVSSLSLDGQPLWDGENSEVMPSTLWVPGENVPTIRWGSSKIEPRSGNSYAAAIAAGILGVVAEAGADLTLEQRIEVLRSTARSVAADGPPALNLKATLEQIGASTSSARGQVIREELVVNMAIPDNDANGITSTIHINPPGTLQRIRVRVHITHVWIGDLLVVLSTPEGDRVVLHDRSGQSSNDIDITYVSDNFPPLANQLGKQGQGDWSLHVSDHSPQDIGTLIKWGLQLEYSEQVPTP